ncbi:hypothetical protein DW794_15445 [Bacteroides caccae]|uniref:Uncharacterized protein n=1 Tax=Bacteroides caccae TaxID=47678 RepID=A0A414YZB7_9BACE|nr:MAG: hypothetical protein BHV72_03780 [Bacteroides sp. 43_46]RHD45926.1 hypothetical protein DW794_15445 [Bacteroides caccae]RHG48842.1 hypothetical protein DW254_14660 [Bacteroides caccae]RHH92877.1 hypothetical protein DW190_06340 [Bacteroides caccae]RYU01146.1 hypothetical protein EAJ00_18475 [Bacteroides caccae]
MFDYFYAYTFVIETDNNNQILKNNRLSLSYLFILNNQFIKMADIIVFPTNICHYVLIYFTKGFS